MHLTGKSVLVLIAALLCCLCLASCSKAPNLQEYIGMSRITEDYTPNDAARDGCVVFEDEKLTAGAETWDIFLKKTILEESALIRLIRFQNGKLFSAVDLQYNGVHYLASKLDGSETLAYDDLKHYTVKNGDQEIDAYVLMCMEKEEEVEADSTEMANFIAENLYLDTYNSEFFVVYASIVD